MRVIAGYTIDLELYASSNSLIYRAHHQRNGVPVILKILREATPTPERLAWFRREYEITRSLANLPGVVQVYGLEQHPSGWVLVLEDIGGESLASLNLAGNLELPAFLRLALELTRILGNVHQQHIIHKDLNPTNIVYHPTMDQLCLIDFGLATPLSRETTTLHSTTVLEGTPRYLAPEQTGRMNRAVDYRSDFYSLGVTFYELLTGRVPFESDDPLELVHSHIARAPLPPHERKPDIPEPLSAIILKLLAKDPDERYQSAYGLQTDLEHCLNDLEPTGTIAPFPIAQQDISDHFALPQKLYGREAELATLLGTFDQVAAGGSALLLVAGAPGTGKTALVGEIYRPLTERRGTFIAGKFDQVQRSIPYLAFAQAFRGLVRHLLTEPEEVFQQWQERITEALGVNGQVVAEVIPDLELVIGKQQPVPELGPQEAQNRFGLVFQHFLKVFTRPEHPLVLFLDDLQWADSSSLKLLEQMFSSSAGGNLFVIGAYRDTEMPAGHPLWNTLDTIRQNGVEPQTLTLGPLNDAAVTTLVQDALHVDATTAQPLAELVQQKTGGNPFFLGEFLKALYVEELLTFDHQQGHWRWELPRVEARQMTDNVIELMTRQVQRLPTATQQELQSAACIGGRFNLATLAAVSERSPAATAAHLEPALLAGLIEPLGVSYQVATLDVEGLTDTVPVEYRFAHDRVQQAAYEQVPANERTARHWHIGRLLLENTPPEQREERLFDIVNQLNAGRVLAANTTERLELAQLNLEAGLKAKASAAFTTAYTSFQVGLKLLPADAWVSHYPLALALHENAAETAYLSGDHETMERLAEVVLAQARDVRDTVKMYEIRMQAVSTQGRSGDAVQLGLTGLKRLGVVLPDTPQPEDVARALQELQEHLKGQPVESLINLPPMTDPSHLAVLQLLIQFFAPCYIAAPALIPLIVTEAVRRSIQAGNAPGSSFVYASTGIILCGTIGDIETGYDCGLLAVRLVEHFRAYAFKAGVDMAFNFHIRNWKDFSRESVPHVLNIYYTALEMGNYFYAGASPVLAHLLAYYAGWNLDELEHSVAQYQHQVIMQMKDVYNGSQLAQLRQAIANLQTSAAQPGVLHGEYYDEYAMIPHYQTVGDGSSIAFLYVHKLLLAYLFENTALLPECITLAEGHVSYLTANPSLVPINMYSSLARLRLYADMPTEEQAILLEKVEANQQQLYTWAQHAPMNFLHKWHLVEAERCRVLRKMGDAWEHYQQAISGAHETRFIQEEALAHELSGRFYLARGQAEEAALSLRRAHRAYAQWGATARVQHLETHYSELFATLAATPIHHTSTGPPPSTSSTSPASALDVASIVKASQAISGEMQLEALLSRLLYVLLESAGADRGALLLAHEGQWRVEAEGNMAGGMTVLHSLPLEKATLPQSLLSYVLRTGEPLVLHNAPTRGDFTSDAYIQAQQPRSVLALPLLHQGTMTGLLYLENTRTAGAFTPERQAMLSLLSGQVAISLENARLYTRMEELVEERTAQLSVALSEAEHARATTHQAEAKRAALQQQIIDTQRELLRELSTPLIPITDSVVIMPLIGTIDTQRAQRIMEMLLEGVAQHRAELAILDITGVSVVDMQVAQALVSTAQAVKLLGAQVMLTGIQPQIAQTLVSLGARLDGVITRGSLQAGIAAALRQ